MLRIPRDDPSIRGQAPGDGAAGVWMELDVVDAGGLYPHVAGSLEVQLDDQGAAAQLELAPATRPSRIARSAPVRESIGRPAGRGPTEEHRRVTRTSDRVRAVYAAHLGDPAVEMPFEQGGLRVSVVKYAPSPATGDVVLYVTAGSATCRSPTNRGESMRKALHRAVMAGEGLCLVGAPEGTRTPNLLIRSQMLYPLSYGRSVRCQHTHRLNTRRLRDSNPGGGISPQPH